MANEKRPVFFEEGGAFTPGAKEAEKHFVQYGVQVVGSYNLMIGMNEHGEPTGDFAFIDSRNGKKGFLGQDPGDKAFFDALRAGENARRPS